MPRGGFGTRRPTRSKGRSAKRQTPSAERQCFPLPFSIAFSSSRSDDRLMSQSIRNKIPGTICEITSEQVLSEVIIDTAIGPGAAVITTRSLRERQLQVGGPVSALIKATNVSIDKGDSKYT